MYRVGQLSLLFSRLVKCQKCFPPSGGQPSPPSTPTPPPLPLLRPGCSYYISLRISLSRGRHDSGGGWAIKKLCFPTLGGRGGGGFADVS